MTNFTHKTLVFSAACLAVTSIALAAPRDTSGEPKAATTLASDFALLDQNGEFHQLSRDKYEKAVVLMSYDASCASDQKALQAFNQVRNTWASRGVGFALLDSKLHQDRNAVRDAAVKSNIDLPILMDHSQLVAELLDVDTSGSVVVLDPANRHVLYKGPVSDQIEEVLRAKVSSESEGAQSAAGDAQSTQANSTQTMSKTLPVHGCAIDFPAKKMQAANVPDYVKDIVPIVTKNCAMCHHDGGIGPFAMSSYKKMKGWSPMIREVLLTKRMPPMQVDPNVGHFDNARYISDGELQTLVHWIDAGSPRGNSANDPLTAEHFGQRTDWQLGKPDYIVTAKTHEIPATGVIDYINDTVELSFKEDKWVRAVQFIPGDPTVLHHLLSYVVGPKESFESAEGGGEGGVTSSKLAQRFLEGYAPGKVDAMVFPKDTGVFIPKGDKLMMQFHYTTNGRATKDTTQVGLYFYDKPPKFEYLNRAVAGPVKIPAGERDEKTAATFVFPEDVIVYGLRAHMHFRGHDMKFSADMPDGTTKELLSVPNYSYAWQPTYQLDQPVMLKAGTKVHVTGSFDNSKYNPANPDPSKNLTFGLQSWDEMFIGYWSYTAVKPTN